MDDPHVTPFSLVLCCYLPSIFMSMVLILLHLMGSPFFCIPYSRWEFVIVPN